MNKISIAVLVPLCLASYLHANDYFSHPPMRPLPNVASNRKVPAAKVWFVDGTNGDDSRSGSESQPWKTIGFAATKLRPGDTLLIRGGIYFEKVEIRARGKEGKPITVGAYPGELVVLDGGISEFQLAPETSWEPLGNGEFRSVNVFPGLGTTAEGHTNLLGNFADSMIPLHGYRFLTDLRSDNHLFHKLNDSKSEQGNGLYCGPGLFYDVNSGHIHVRLAHTKQPSLNANDNYSGETDPRKLKLVIAGHGASPLTLNKAAHVRVQDIVCRGSRETTINVEDCSNITFDGVTSYGGSSALRIESTGGLRCVNSAFRGIAAPWLWRWSLKYRSIEARIVSASSWNPPARTNNDFEFAYCEFTDCVDGVFIGNVENCLIHHCLLDNVSDDGFFVTCQTAYDGTVSGSAELHHNRISTVLSAFAYGVGHGRQKTLDEAGNKQLGKLVHAHHNVFDLRSPVQYQEPKSGPITTYGRVNGDHGSPVWEPLNFEQNTVLSHDSPWRNYYAAGWGKAMGKGTSRRIAGNIFRHELGMPGDILPLQEVALETERNIHWSDEAGESGTDSFLKRFRNSALYKQTGWTKDDLYTSPKDAPADVGAGEDVPVGQFGRLTLYGNENTDSEIASESIYLRPFKNPPLTVPSKRAALVLGYPAFDAPLLKFALEKQGVEVDVFEKTWLPAERFGDYDLVAIAGSTVRARMVPSGFAEAEFQTVRDFIEEGGILIVGRELSGMLFPGDAGVRFRESIFGAGGKDRAPPNLQLLDKKHPWVAHLDNVNLRTPAASPIWLRKGRNLIGDSKLGRSILADVSVGDGRFVYVGWEISKLLPPGRSPSTQEQEAAYEEQYQIYESMIRDLIGL